MPEGANRTPVRIAVIDSGVQAGHPHIDASRLEEGVDITKDGRLSCGSDCGVDRLGHGTAVTAAIQQWAPDARIVPLRIFDGALRASPRALVAAIDWCATTGVDLINLSLGTTSPAHGPVLGAACERALAAGAVTVAACEADGVPCFPGSFPGVLGVGLDWDCPRDNWRWSDAEEGKNRLFASGHPRPVPGVPPRRNLHGISFAVANITGFSAAILAQQNSPLPGGYRRLELLRGSFAQGACAPA